MFFRSGTIGPTTLSRTTKWANHFLESTSELIQDTILFHSDLLDDSKCLSRRIAYS